MKETVEEAAERFFPTNKKGSLWMPNVDELSNQFRQEGFIKCAKWQQEQLCNSEIIQRIRVTKSDAEARRIIKSI